METSFAVSNTILVRNNGFEPLRLIELMSTAPAAILGCEGGTLESGSRADIAILDPDYPYTVPRDGFRSRGVNTPFAGMEFTGAVMMTIASGEIIYER